ncbi:hydrolase [Kitasatospora phosalacinea]|uniref:Hydrolase n=1 Tax=Kitasatospora phosalacinea TaxID=2065 RepID=A0A9W6QGL1_9ACTN|nr:HAD family hydrolase [Kitasatospora phosalacinea]GLW74453.1 hydrolase [Kitasatospora phosalacinea]
MATAVMFDFSGTLFRVETATAWLDAALDAVGATLTAPERVGWASSLERVGALPGGAWPQAVPPHLAEVWQERDLDLERHRAAYTGLAQSVGPLPHPDLAAALYERHMAPQAWHAYPDTHSTLTELRRRGVPVAVVSNIAWDLRPVFRHHGLEAAVDAFVLSFEYHRQKPDPELFRAACEQLGREPEDIVMVGDDATADGGATALGCTFLQVRHAPTVERPNALTAVLDLLDR